MRTDVRRIHTVWWLNLFFSLLFGQNCEHLRPGNNLIALQLSSILSTTEGLVLKSCLFTFYPPSSWQKTNNTREGWQTSRFAPWSVSGRLLCWCSFCIRLVVREDVLVQVTLASLLQTNLFESLCFPMSVTHSTVPLGTSQLATGQILHVLKMALEDLTPHVLKLNTSGNVLQKRLIF